ncbi:MAG: polyprenyl synthetase family protein [Fimbriimonadaceae bacterium]|nr:polyprenyl synthetase family protein [Fimbriimonadaceae bacterium]
MKVASFFSKIAENVTGLNITPKLVDEMSRWTEEVEAELHRQIGSPIKLVEDVSALTLDAGGKRLRPALVRLSAAATGQPYDAQRVIRLGTAMEMIHMATLIHDDVIDDAATRRGKPTAFSQYGNTASILGGDVLLAKAMKILAEDGDLPIIRTVSQAVVELAEGEVRELELRGELMVSREDHLQVLRMKTASFIECCCRIGAMIATPNEQVQNSLGAYGHHLGMAFQIVDDLLDFRGDTKKTGKPLATDFREGQATLPLLYLIPELSDEESAFVGKKFGNGSTDAEIDQIIGWMNSCGSLGQADQDAREHGSLANLSLESLPDSPEKNLLLSVTKFVLARQS